MTTNLSQLSPRNKGILRATLVTALILGIPLVAMRFTTEVNWTLFDFVVMGTLLFSTGLIYELKIARIPGAARRTVAAVALALGFFLIWAQLAVGLISQIIAGRFW